MKTENQQLVVRRSIKMIQRREECTDEFIGLIKKLIYSVLECIPYFK